MIKLTKTLYLKVLVLQLKLGNRASILDLDHGLFAASQQKIIALPILY